MLDESEPIKGQTPSVQEGSAQAIATRPLQTHLMAGCRLEITLPQRLKSRVTTVQVPSLSGPHGFHVGFRGGGFVFASSGGGMEAASLPVGCAFVAASLAPGCAFVAASLPVDCGFAADSA